tara:strand:+ start:1092 stop:1640 length:549 start_codon:yes stop_codon:yes gene_type:complete
MSQLKVNSIVPTGGLPSGSSGGIIQVKQTVLTAAISYSPSGPHVWTDMPNFNCTITPSSTSSNILIVIGIGACHQNSGTIAGKLLRGSTDIGVGDANGNRPRSSFRMYGAAIYNTNHSGSYHFTFLDTGIATTSATTYKLQTQAENGSSYPVYLNRSVQDTNEAYSYRSTTCSTMTLYEVTN